jgi:hypothetical protein
VATDSGNSAVDDGVTWNGGSKSGVDFSVRLLLFILTLALMGITIFTKMTSYEEQHREVLDARSKLARLCDTIRAILITPTGELELPPKAMMQAVQQEAVELSDGTVSWGYSAPGPSEMDRLWRFSDGAVPERSKSFSKPAFLPSVGSIATVSHDLGNIMTLRGRTPPGDSKHCSPMLRGDTREMTLPLYSTLMGFAEMGNVVADMHTAAAKHAKRRYNRWFFPITFVKTAVMLGSGYFLVGSGSSESLSWVITTLVILCGIVQKLSVNIQDIVLKNILDNATEHIVQARLAKRFSTTASNLVYSITMGHREGPPLHVSLQSLMVTHALLFRDSSLVFPSTVLAQFSGRWKAVLQTATRDHHPSECIVFLNENNRQTVFGPPIPQPSLKVGGAVTRSTPTVVPVAPDAPEIITPSSNASRDTVETDLDAEASGAVVV